MGQERNLTQATIQGTLWIYTSKYSGKFLVFISTIVLARLLLKEDFGIAGYALVIIGFLEVLEGLGIGPAIIYHREDAERLDTAFWVGLGVGIALFGLTWAIAPLAGLFFNDPRAVPVTRVLGLEFPISAFGLVPSALLTKHLAFGRKFIPEMGRSVAKGVASITLALMGFGAWSLIWGQLVGILVQTVILWIVVPWRPSLRFRSNVAPSLLSYGTGVVSLEGLGVLMLNADYLLIGRFLGAAALGVYTLAFRIPELLVKQFCTIVGNVTFPIYTKIKDEPRALKRGFLMTMRYVTMITIPMGLGLAIVARPFILTFFTDKWAEAIPVMSAISLYTLFRSLVFNAGGVYKAKGRPGLLSMLNFFQALISIPVLWWSVVYYQTIVAVAWMQVLLALVFGVVKLVMASRLVDTTVTELLKSFYPATVAGIVMSVVILIVGQLLVNSMPLVELIAEVAIGGSTYIGALWWLQREDVLRAGMILRGILLSKARQPQST